MKKTLMMMTALALASFAAADSTVSSGNIVGYTKVNLKGNDYSMFGMSFEGCGIGQKVKIQDLIGTFYGGTEYSYADNLLVFNPTTSGYNEYYFGDAAGSWGDPAYWDKKWYWADDDGEPTDHEIGAGEAFWFNRRSGVTELTIAGQVPMNNVVVSIASGYRLIGNPFPVDIEIQDLQGTFFGGTEYSYADNLLVFDPTTSGYREYYFGDAAGSWGDPAYWDKKWYWADDDGEPTDHKMGPGAAFWFNHRGSGCTLTIPAPVIQ